MIAKRASLMAVWLNSACPKSFFPPFGNWLLQLTYIHSSNELFSLFPYKIQSLSVPLVESLWNTTEYFQQYIHTSYCNDSNFDIAAIVLYFKIFNWPILYKGNGSEVITPTRRRSWVLLLTSLCDCRQVARTNFIEFQILLVPEDYNIYMLGLLKWIKWDK